MAWLLGIDEAGYGPNLGPLAVAATAWHVVNEGTGDRGRGTGQAGLALRSNPTSVALDLYVRLASVVSPAPDAGKVAIADSKTLYKPGGGLGHLERGVLVAFGACGGRRPPARWSELVGPHVPEIPWYREFDCDLPIDASENEIEGLTNRFTAACETASTHLANLQVRMVFPREFNELTAHFGTKGAALSHVSIGLVRSVCDALDPQDEPVFVTCDKHGGRNRYGALLQHHFPEHWIDTLAESGPESRYSWGPESSRVEVRFRTKGEAELPVALASMAAKYSRELAMRAFNEFWCREVPGLRPTAGYPLDAKRFKAAIAPRLAELEIDEDDLWRYK